MSELVAIMLAYFALMAFGFIMYGVAVWFTVTGINNYYGKREEPCSGGDSK